MKALVYRGVGDIRLEDVPKPQIQGSEEAIVRITSTAICGSDLHILHGHLGVEPGTIIGHEFTGVVEEVGVGVSAVKPGDRVVGAAGTSCGQCPACRLGLTMACEHFGMYGTGPMFGNLQGAQAEYIRVFSANFTLQKIPEGLSDEQVLFVGDILSTAYMGAVGISPRGHGVQPGHTVAIFGAGPVGLCAVAAAKLFSPVRIIVIDQLDYRLDMAKRLGADHVINATQTDPAAAIMKMTGDWGADFVIEAVGVPETLAAGLSVVAPGGTVSVVGLFQGPVEIPIHTLITKNIAIKMGLADLIYMRKLLGLIQAGKMDLTPMITHTLPLAEGVHAYEIFDKKLDRVIKVILKP